MRKSAFTLLEVVIVIVVLGIVAMIGTDIITHMYEGYIRTKVVNKLQTRTDQVLAIIAKRLSYRIKDSAVASKPNGSPTSRIYKKLSDSGITADYDVLEWIGYDNEGMIGEWDGNRYSGWNGFIDIDNTSTNKNQLVSSGSRLDLADKSIKALSYGDITINSINAGKSVGLIFKCSHDMSIKSYGYIDTSHSNIYKVTRAGGGSNEILAFQDTSSKDVCEQYYLAWSAYAIVPEGANSNDFNLTLKYNYQPWEAERFYSTNTKSQVLAEHVSTFRFIQTGHILRFKLCMKDPQTTYGFCKEKAVY